QRAVGEIDDAHDPEHQRQAAGDQEQQQPVLHAVEELGEETGEIHEPIAKWRIANGTRVANSERRMGLKSPIRYSLLTIRFSSHFAAGARIGKLLDRDADHLVLAARDLAQVDVVNDLV